MINMKTNLFRVKEKNEKEKKIIIEEERTKNPFLLFLKRHRSFILTSIITLIICLLLISGGIAFSLFLGSNDYDISYISGDETIDSNNDPDIGDEDVEEDLLGEIARSQGIVYLVETFMSSQGDVISYYTDGTSVVVKSNGKIYRISTNNKGKYVINRNGKIDESAKKILVTSTTTTLMDGTNITYYSDGTAKVELKNETIFVRDSNNVKIDNGTSFNNAAPSGVALARETQKINNTNMATIFTDQTSLVIKNDTPYIVNKNTDITIEETNINYDKNNSFAVISKKTYEDGNTITHFENGAATITDKNGNVTYVKKSGDIFLKDQKLYEIIPNDYGYSRTTFNCSDGKKVTYFDNGAAVIINPDGTRQYVEDNTQIIYDNNKNMISNPEIAKQISEKTTTNGQKVFNFDNGKSQVIEEDGTSYIVDTSKLTFKPDGSIAEDPEKPGHDGKGEVEGTPHDPGEGIYISEAENKYNEFKNIENTRFIIKNTNNKSKVLRIAIEEVSNYRKYNTSRLEPRYVKFQSTVGDNYIPVTRLTQNTWVDSDGTTNYIIYDGTIAAKSTVQVAVTLYVDYAELDNSHQNKGFIGTIKIYVEDDWEEIR